MVQASGVYTRYGLSDDEVEIKVHENGNTRTFTSKANTLLNAFKVPWWRRRAAHTLVGKVIDLRNTIVETPNCNKLAKLRVYSGHGLNEYVRTFDMYGVDSDRRERISKVTEIVAPYSHMTDVMTK